MTVNVGTARWDNYGCFPFFETKYHTQSVVFNNNCDLVMKPLLDSKAWLTALDSERMKVWTKNSHKIL